MQLADDAYTAWQGSPPAVWNTHCGSPGPGGGTNWLKPSPERRFPVLWPFAHGCPSDSLQQHWGQILQGASSSLGAQRQDVRACCGGTRQGALAFRAWRALKTASFSPPLQSCCCWLSPSRAGFNIIPPWVCASPFLVGSSASPVRG